MTIGIDAVDFLAARVAAGTIATITSTLRRTSSAARLSNRSVFPSASRHSMARFSPSRYPRSRRLCRKSAGKPVPAEGPGARTPIRHSFPLCASAPSGAARRPAEAMARKTRRSITGSPFSRTKSVGQLAQHRPSLSARAALGCAIQPACRREFHAPYCRGPRERKVFAGNKCRVQARRAGQPCFPCSRTCTEP